MQRVSCVLVRVTAEPPVALILTTALDDGVTVLSVLVVLAADALGDSCVGLEIGCVKRGHVSIGKDLASQGRLVRVSITVAVVESTGDTLTTAQIRLVFPLTNLFLNRGVGRKL